MSLRLAPFQLSNWLFKRHFPAYYLLYYVWKIVTDRQERRAFKRLIKSGMVVIDVGANIGVHSRYFSRLAGPTGKIHAFEPSPANFDHLREGTKNLKNLVLNCAAVGKDCGIVKLYQSNEINVDHRIFDSGDQRKSIDVPIVSLDEYFAPGQRVDFIKIDVQGAEMGVISGARRLLTENHNVKIIMEFWPYGLEKAGTNPSKLLDYLAGMGFSIFSVSGDDKMQPVISNLKASSAKDYINLLVARQVTSMSLQVSNVIRPC